MLYQKRHEPLHGPEHGAVYEHRPDGTQTGPKVPGPLLSRPSCSSSGAGAWVLQLESLGQLEVQLDGRCLVLLAI